MPRRCDLESLKLVMLGLNSSLRKHPFDMFSQATLTLTACELSRVSGSNGHWIGLVQEGQDL